MQVFLDTNIFLYAAGEESAYREPCRNILKHVADRKVQAVTNVEVVQEIIYVLHRRGNTADGIRLGKSILELFPDMLPVSHQDMQLALKILARHKKIQPRDAVHAACMINNAILNICSTDRHFDSIRDVRRLDPVKALKSFR